ncbi:MAG: arylsulfatase [Isosphaeraceae bacterium]
MPRSCRGFVAILNGLAACIVAPAVASAEDAPRPNIVVILADDLGSYDVGWRGSPIATPRLDRLAKAGARLEAFYVQPVCSPTRAALMTGRYPLRYGLQSGVVRPWAQYGLPLEERTLPQALHDVGYETAIVGKWHLGHFRPEYLPTRRGFDHQYGHYNGALDYYTHIRDGGFDWHRDDKACRDEGYSTHLLADEAVRLIEQRDQAKPLFLYVPFNGVHAPHQVPEKYKAPYADMPEPRRTYAGMVAAVDEAVGKIDDAIDKAGIRDTTLIVFSSDNGGPNPGKLSSNGALRAGKGTVYEGGTRTCAFATWPGKIAAGSEVKAPLHIVDLYPTLLKLAGAPLDQPLPIDGRDAWPSITNGAPSPHDVILLNGRPEGGAIRRGDWKLIVGQATSGDDEGGEAAPADAPPKAATKKAAAKKAAREAERVELYNLADDPRESKNLADAQPERVRELRAAYEAILKPSVPPRNRPKPADFRSPAVWGEAEAQARPEGTR